MTCWCFALSLCLQNQTRLDNQGVIYSRQRWFSSRLDFINHEIESSMNSRVRPLQCLSLELSLLLNHVASHFWKELATLTSHQENGVICLAFASVGDPFSLCWFGVPLPGYFLKPGNYSTRPNISVMTFNVSVNTTDNLTCHDPWRSLIYTYSVAVSCNMPGAFRVLADEEDEEEEELQRVLLHPPLATNQGHRDHGND